MWMNVEVELEIEVVEVEVERAMPFLAKKKTCQKNGKKKTAFFFFAKILKRNPIIFFQ